MYLRGEKFASENCAELRHENCAELRAAHRKRPPSASLRLPVRESVLTSSDALASSVERRSHSRTSCSAGTTAASSRALGASEIDAPQQHEAVPHVEWTSFREKLGERASLVASETPSATRA